MITRFSRSFIKTCVENKVCDESKLRHYDIMKDHNAGMTLQQIANKYGMTKVGIYNIVHKYK